MRIFGIIGRPLGHSFSKDYFSRKFEASGLAGECRYLNFPLDDIAELDKVLDEYPDLCGFNVTIPYKREILPWLDSISDEARRIGAVNCVKVAGGKLAGYNTDVYGFGIGLEKLLCGEALAGLRALVLGTGGAAAAVKYELARSGIEYAVVSRSGGREGRTRDHGGGLLSCGEDILSYGELTSEIVARHRLLVNATPLGTFPDVDGKPDIPYDAIGAGYFLYDLVYNPQVTAFLAEGVRRGAAVLNGETMLCAQAEKGWEIWNR